MESPPQPIQTLVSRMSVVVGSYFFVRMNLVKPALLLSGTGWNMMVLRGETPKDEGRCLLVSINSFLEEGDSQIGWPN